LSKYNNIERIQEGFSPGVYDNMDGFNQDMNLNKEVISKRINTGIDKLDELLSGGLPRNSITLVSGTPGSGKTILCYHYLLEGLKNGENCLYLTSDERIENIIKQAGELGFNFQHWTDQGKLRFLYLDLDKWNIHKEMDEAIKTGNFSRVVLDSLTPVSEVPVWISSSREIIPYEDSGGTEKFPSSSIPSTRMNIRRIMSILGKENCTALVTSEVPEGSRSLSRDTISEFIVDGIIMMDLDVTMDRRKLTIRKMRTTNHTLKPQDIIITQGGIKIL
jgi:circadian clock protein KaiC